MEAELRFEREDIGGIAVVGTYLIDAARRLGVDIHDDCGRLGLCDTCAVKVTKGAEHLTAPTKAELEMLSDERRAAGERLACQAKIMDAGEIVVATLEKKDPRSERERRDEEFRRDFEALPLEQKIAQLVDLEAVTLSETLSFVINSPYKIGGAVVDFLSRFGFSIEAGAKTARTPDEHREETVAEPPADERPDEPATEPKDDDIIDAIPVDEAAGK